MRSTLLPILVLAATSALADEKGTLIFQDDFNRDESQETKDEIGNGWNTNSKARAAGNKQTDLKDGALHIYVHEVADHAVSVTHDAEFTDGAVQLRFKQIPRHRPPHQAHAAPRRPQKCRRR